jgi:two-component system, OmpR family, response regulator
LPDMRPKVLVLDEDILALELYSRELGSDYQVITSNSVSETRQLLANQHLDVLVIEPEVNEDEGWRLLQDIQSIADPPSVILCSVVDERKAGLDQGASLYLVKPVLPHTLHHMVNQLIAKKTNRSTLRPGKGA